MKSLFFCSCLVVVVVSERLYVAPDLTSSGRASSNSDDSRFPITGSNRAQSPSGSSGSFGFDSDSGSDSRFPVTGGRGSSGSRVSGGSGGSQFGSSLGSGSRVSGGSGSRVSGSGSSGSVDGTTKNYYVRIVASLVRLGNDKSLTSTGSGCAMFSGKCDPIVYADLDADRPNANWPGPRDPKVWTKLFVGKGQGTFDINVDNITRDICGQNYREANLRVRVEDKKTLTSNAVINEFDCPINRVPEDSSLSAAWSPMLNCIARFPAGKQTLTYRYKVFYVSKSSCGVSAPPTTTTSRSIFG